ASVNLQRVSRGGHRRAGGVHAHVRGKTRLESKPQRPKNTKTFKGLSFVPSWRVLWHRATMTATPSPTPSSLKRHHLGAFAGWQQRLFGPAPGEHRDPVLDEIWRAAVDSQPRQAVTEDAPVRERALRPDARPQVAKTTLETENLP